MIHFLNGLSAIVDSLCFAIFTGIALSFIGLWLHGVVNSLKEQERREP